jgi:DnaJ-class molecular chaperone
MGDRMTIELWDILRLCRRCGGAGEFVSDTTLCPDCSGNGTTHEMRAISVAVCDHCKGSGYIVQIVELPDESYEYRTDPCKNCSGGKSD